jgi:hypothetical protein
MDASDRHQPQGPRHRLPRLLAAFGALSFLPVAALTLVAIGLLLGFTGDAQTHVDRT